MLAATGRRLAHWQFGVPLVRIQCVYNMYYVQYESGCIQYYPYRRYIHMKTHDIVHTSCMILQWTYNILSGYKNTIQFNFRAFFIVQLYILYCSMFKPRECDPEMNLNSLAPRAGGKDRPSRDLVPAKFLSNVPLWSPPYNTRKRH